MKQGRFFTVVLFLSAIFALFGTEKAAAEAVSYDRYTPALRKAETVPAGKNAANQLLVYPLELLKWPVDQGLLFTEKHRLDRKTKWFLDKLDEYGISPNANIMFPHGAGGGGNVDFMRMLSLKTRFPDAIAEGWIEYNHHIVFDVGGKIGLDRIRDTGFRTYGLFDYQKRSEEHFFGIGPHTSRGDGYVYKMENTTLGYAFGYSPKPDLGADFKLKYQKVNIYGGQDGSMGQIRTGIFTENNVPGLRGDEILSLGPEINYDTRNAKDNSTRGGEHRLAFNYNKGFDHSNGAMYFKYEAEISRYLRLWSDRRILVLHLYGETNSQLPGYYVPFHQMPKLGGMGEFPRLGHTLRGYEFNRFTDNSALLYNMEYRYNIWKYREFKVDTTVFWDLGQVFRKVSEFQFGNFRSNYGLGFRFNMANVSIMTIQTAFGEEGMQYYVESKTPF